MTAEVEIVLGTASNVLTILSSVLGTPDGDDCYTVQVLDEVGTVTPAEIEIGLDNRIRAEVKSGLSEGDRIVTGNMAGGGLAGGEREASANGADNNGVRCTAFFTSLSP